MKTCPFCAEEIREAAIRCKHCRAELTLQREAAAPRRAHTRVLTERTSKRLKAHQVVAGLTLALTGIWSLASAASPDGMSTVATTGLVLAIAYGLVVRVLVWWNHH